MHPSKECNRLRSCADCAHTGVSPGPLPRSACGPGYEASNDLRLLCRRIVQCSFHPPVHTHTHTHTYTHSRKQLHVYPQYRLSVQTHMYMYIPTQSKHHATSFVLSSLDAVSEHRPPVLLHDSQPATGGDGRLQGTGGSGHHRSHGSLDK